MPEYPDWIDEADRALWDQLPRHMREGLHAYVYLGRRPGDFLLAVLSNDFCNAAVRADAQNYEALRVWALFMMIVMPSASRGSRLAVNEWIRGGGLARREELERERNDA